MVAPMMEKVRLARAAARARLQAATQALGVAEDYLVTSEMERAELSLDVQRLEDWQRRAAEVLGSG